MSADCPHQPVLYLLAIGAAATAGLVIALKGMRKGQPADTASESELAAKAEQKEPSRSTA